MALIKCPECGKEISDKSKQCMHCGYPIQERLQTNTKCYIDNYEYDFVDVFNLVKNGKYKEAFLKIRSIYNMSFYNCLNIIEFIQLTNSVPEYYDIKVYSKKDEEYAYKKIISMTDKKVNSNQPKCPTCNSTNIKKITTTSKITNTVLFGIFGTKRHKIFHCNSCGYEW